MACYFTPPSLPRTPIISCSSKTGMAIPAELISSSWAAWRQPKHDAPLTPPMSAVPHSRRTPDHFSAHTVPHTMTLPPITSFVTPMTPPQSLDRRSSSSRLPPIEDAFPTRPAETDPDLYSDSDEEDSDEIMDSLAEPVESTMEDAYPDPEPQPLNDAHAPHFVDWLDNTLKRPVSFVAEKTCEMICYLWFATALPSPSPHPSHSPPQHPRTNTNTTALQLAASPAFIAFLQKVLETTQVGQSVIVLSLHYIYLLKARNCLAAAQAGSEFRIAIAALMMANKFLDDNTYTNRTWSDVSGIGLEEVNRMEREFLVGVGWECFVDGATYGKWRDLLRGLVAAKERDRRMWNGKGVRAARSSGRLGHGTPSKGYAARNGRAQPPQTRARSTSPSRFAYAFEFTAPHSISPPQPHTRSGPASSQPYSASSLHPSAYNTPSTSTSNYDHPAYADTFSPTPNPRSGCKRHATDAFSPDFRPSKAQKPTPGSLLIPEHPQTQPQRNSPLDSLQAFATMSLASSNGAPYTPESRSSSPAPGPAWNHHREPEVPHTLVAAYRAGGPVNVPQNLYYYSLAGSAHEDEEENNRRKAKLRRHQPPQQAYPTYYAPQRVQQHVQSARTSPVHYAYSAYPQPQHNYALSNPHSQPQPQPHTAALPHFHDTVWTRPNPNLPPHAHAPSHQALHSYAPSTGNGASPVPSAPFANAGPPGFHGQFYTPPPQVQQQPSPLEGYWTRGRRFS
ncbi:hypothetical protein FIBSPDRAFT_924845 [Athelia psychrophila]|uniref:Cyclin-like domain-containing protein n=1 Tax=Athelia psychrophila TaxID=1759441 RepID=A0A166VJI1_9AGAM|nr:hypothetical protein FIBSPDRAFT_924845 [Fibularhizoctonia sp. CBS 109695]